MELSHDDLINLYRWMVLTRAFEWRICELTSSGQAVELQHASIGQEAIAVGCCYSLRQDDYVMPSLRTRGAYIVRGIPLRTQMAGVLARSDGAARGKITAHHMGDLQCGVLAGTGLVGSSISVAAGAALGFKILGTDQVVVDFFGDGATNRGDFHEALNLAAIFDLPVVFACENNLYSEYTPIGETMRIADIADRAASYGMPGIVVDGNDVLAVHAAVQEAVDRARGGEGPTLLECKTYRHRNHAEMEPPEMFRPAEEIEYWLAQDPIPRLRDQMLQDGVITDETVGQIEVDVQEQVEDALEFALASPFPPLDEITRDVYAPAQI